MVARFVPGSFGPPRERDAAAIRSLLGEPLRRGEAVQEVPEFRTKAAAVRFAMEHTAKLRLVYRRHRAGRTAEYLTRPYEVGVHAASGAKVLFATEDNKHGPGAIHSFLWARIASADAVRRTRFVPRWPVQIDSV